MHPDVGVCSIGYDGLIPVLLLRQQIGHAVQPAPGLWNGRDAAATRPPADATGCIGKSAPAGSREADDPGLRNRVEARAGESRAKVENSVAHAASAFPETKRPDLSAPHSWLARAFAQQQVSDAPTPEYRFGRPDVAELASALATGEAPGRWPADERFGIEGSRPQPTGPDECKGDLCATRLLSRRRRQGVRRRSHVIDVATVSRWRTLTTCDINEFGVGRRPAGTTTAHLGRPNAATSPTTARAMR